MIQYLPTGKFKWLTSDEIDTFDVNSFQKDNKEDYLLKVNIEYPEELHDLHN